MATERNIKELMDLPLDDLRREIVETAYDVKQLSVAGLNEAFSIVKFDEVYSKIEEIEKKMNATEKEDWKDLLFVLALDFSVNKLITFAAKGIGAKLRTELSKYFEENQLLKTNSPTKNKEILKALMDIKVVDDPIQLYMNKTLDLLEKVHGPAEHVSAPSFIQGVYTYFEKSTALEDSIEKLAGLGYKQIKKASLEPQDESDVEAQKANLTIPKDLKDKVIILQAFKDATLRGLQDEHTKFRKRVDSETNKLLLALMFIPIRENKNLFGDFQINSRKKYETLLNEYKTSVMFTGMTIESSRLVLDPMAWGGGHSVPRYKSKDHHTFFKETVAVSGLVSEGRLKHIYRWFNYWISAERLSKYNKKGYSGNYDLELDAVNYDGIVSIVLRQTIMITPSAGTQINYCLLHVVRNPLLKQLALLRSIDSQVYGSSPFLEFGELGGVTSVRSK